MDNTLSYRQKIQNKGTVWKMLFLLLSFNLIAALIHAIFFIKGGSFTLNEETYPKLFFFFVALGIVVLAIVLLRIGNYKALILGCTFSALPLVFTSALIIAKLDLVIKREHSQALYYYHTSSQQNIALAIEYNNVELLNKLMNETTGDKKISGYENGYSYLQFALEINCLKGKQIKSFKKILKILLESGIPANDALNVNPNCLSSEYIALLLSYGVDPNVSIKGKDPIIFSMIGKGEKENAIVLLLIKSGANIDARNLKNQTPVIVAAQAAVMSPENEGNWELVYQLLKLRADFTCSATDGSTLGSIIREAKADAARKKQSMPANFFIVSKWMADHHYVDVPF